MTYHQLETIAKESGFSAWAPLDVATIQLKPEVREMCAANTCGMYAKRWSCPPGCGTLEELRGRIDGYTRGILVQSVGDVEDGFDFEAMMEIEAEHKERFSQMQRTLLEFGNRILAIGSGCCTLCRECTYPGEPCRFPEKQVASMEAYGMLVLDICKANNLTYYYGADKMAYTSCFLIDLDP